ncbi:InlB B-repeat-containing protein [Adlercreutzia sp. ZJ242]|uniref:InlB B-repeat-containing protein n=1 Tax=Adlercreutzia sp. ZJ242 TaxID=2709409 RepID=UPI0013EA17BC|nr:InlB B-repeat-containing protein [Adlercreutzia sp. ZJ242]
MREIDKRKTSPFERVLSVTLALLLALSCFNASGTVAVANEPASKASAQVQAQEQAQTPAQEQTPAAAHDQTPTTTPEQAPAQEQAPASTQTPAQDPEQAPTQEPTSTPAQSQNQDQAQAQDQEKSESAQAPEQAAASTQTPKQAPTRASEQTAIDFSTYQNSDLDIYSAHYYATSANQTIERSSGSYSIRGFNDKHDIVVGNHPVDEKPNTNALDVDIPIFLNGLEAAQSLIVKPVGSLLSDGGTYTNRTTLTVANASRVGNLKVDAHAVLDIILDEDLTVTSMTLEQGSTLTVTGSGTLTVTDTFESKGTVALNGGTIDAQKGISAQTLTVNGATVKASGKDISASDNVSLKDGKVQDAALFGYKNVPADSEPRTLTLEGSNEFSSVAAVGCSSDDATVVSITGIETVRSSSSTTFYNDYTITYKNGAAEVKPSASWPTAYRVSTKSNSFNGATIAGYHTSEGYKAESPVPLPKDYTQAGYELTGWKIEGSESVITELSSTQEEIVLMAALEPGKVTIKLDLGFDPNVYTSDKDDEGNVPARKSEILTRLNDDVELPMPFQFGYKFTGWKIVSGENPRIVQMSDKYNVELNDCVLEDENSVINMQACWKADTFGLTLFLGSDVTEDEDLEISVDGGESYTSFNDLNVSDVKVEGRSITFSPNKPIEYGKTISEYLRTFFPQLPQDKLPILRDKRNSDEKQSFSGWSSISGAVDGTTKYLYGAGGMLVPTGSSLKDYQNDLHKNSAAINAVWGVMSYGLTLPETMPEGWSLTYASSDGTVKTIAENSQTGSTVLAQQGSTVTLTTSATEPENFSLWDFRSSATTDHGNKILPKEKKHNAGNPELHYTFTMPAANVTAKYGKGQKIWIDIAKSPILFEEGVENNNRNVNGFWYADLIDGLTPLFQHDTKILSGTKTDGTAITTKAYFYQWDFADKFCVTSNGTATQNQLTLVNALSSGVWLENVNLTMREAYINNTNGSLLNGKDCESSQDDKGLTSQNVAESFKDVDLTDYANIVLDINNHSSYPTTLHFEGKENTVGAIMHNKLQISNYSPLKLEGDGKDGSAVQLGAAFGYFKYDVTKITVAEYTKKNPQNDFKYLLYGAHQAGFQVTDAVIRAPHKNVHAGFLMHADEKAIIQSSEVELYSICVFEGVEVIDSYLRIHENARFGRIPIQLKMHSKVVIDGNLEMNFHHMNDKGDLTDDTDNWLVVKGTFCDISNYSWKNGTLICNNLVLGRTGGVQGGTVITNQITSQAVGFWSYDKENHKYTYDPLNNNRSEKADQNNDDYPFLVYNQNTKEPNTYTFSGGQIYLLGYYKTTADKKYDSSVTAMGENNPVKSFMEGLYDNNGDLIDKPTVKTNDVLNAVKDSTLKNNECVVLGNSSDDYSTMRFVEISGSAQIYAAGNITFYNDTTVSGGSIYCNGSFGSKGDLTVTGGSIEATAVGNAYNLKTTMEDGTLRWKRTDIQGGTVAVDRIGAFEKRVSDGTTTPAEADWPRSTVTIGTGATINGTVVEGATTTSTPKICHDVYINYIFDTALFNNDGTPTNSNTLRFETSWDGSKTFENQSWNNTALNFTAPNVIGESGGTGNWNWNSLYGEKVTNITAAGIAQNDGADLPGEKSAYGRVQMKLYAVKQNYNLIFKAGASEITAITCNDATVEKTDTDGKITASVKAGGNVVLTFENAAMAKDKTVLWYIDGSNIIHSVNPTVSGSKISFTMPNSDVEVYVTENMTLDLDVASYTLLKDGFRTEANNPPERTDSTFHYLGNLVIQQGSITEDIAFNIESNFGKYQMKEPKKGNKTLETTNKILVDKDFNNTASDSRNVTLRRIYQNGTTTSHGIDLEDEAKARFLLDGAIRICRVRVPEHSDFTLIGKNNDRTQDAIYPIVIGRPETNDWASIGNFYGKAGNITLQNLTILGEESGLNGSLGYSNADSNNTVQYINCVYKTETNGKGYCGWHDRGYFARHAGTVIFDGCNFTLRVSRDWPGFFCDDSENLTIRNHSNITITHNGAYDGNPASPFYAKIDNSFVVEDSELNLSLRVPGNGEPNEDDGRTYRVSLRASRIPPIELRGNATLVLEQRALLNKLVIGGTSEVKAGQNGDGYLLCQDIQVNENATLEAGGIIVSGFYDPSKSKPYKEFETENDFQKAMAEGKYIHNGKDASGKDYPGLVVNGNGAVTAKKYITGDVNGKITVNGGTVTAPIIGTTGKLYGYTRYVPRLGEKYIYTYERTPVGATVDIKGGTVNVAQPEGAGESGAVPYLGGIRTNINISGGTVNLGDGAVLGITKEQQTTLEVEASSYGHSAADYSGTLGITGGTINESNATANGGSILMPYGTINVSGESTVIQVRNMIAYRGNITISDKAGTKQVHGNTYEGDDKKHGSLGISVSELMSAQNLIIENGAVVFAASAYANVPKDQAGSIKVVVDEANRAFLYTTEAYGVIGEGNGTYDYNDGAMGSQDAKNVFGTKVVDVHYDVQSQGVLLDGDVDKVKNPNLDSATGLPYYTVVNKDSTEKTYTLQDAQCSGYTFLGWYVYDPVANQLKGDRVYTINKENPSAVYLGAKWEKVKVKFQVQVEVDESECNGKTMEFVGEGKEGEKLYSFNKIAEVCYGDTIQTSQGVYLANYTTKTQGVLEVTYGEKLLSPESKVTSDMADAFVKGNGEPLVLKVTDNGLKTVNVLITLNMNKTGGRPRDAVFNLGAGPINSGGDSADTVSAYASIDVGLGDMQLFANSSHAQQDGLIHPTAPGYTFEGWYTNPGPTGSPVTSATRLEDLYNADTTTLYAKWTSNVYVVQFSAKMCEETKLPEGESRWVTVDNAEPSADAGAVPELEYFWTYDTAPNKGEFFWTQNGTEDLKYHANLPCAWREGYVFTGWEFEDTHKEKHSIDDEKELSNAVMDNLQIDNYVGSSPESAQTPALTLYAKYRKVQVSYDLNGGVWMGAGILGNKEMPDYGKPLAGYREGAASDGENEFETLGRAESADGEKVYYVRSTKSSHFEDSDGSYVEGDYRFTLSLKGYTFNGWKKAGEGDSPSVHYGCTPRFDDLDLVAEWVSNTYSLELHVKNAAYEASYESAFSDPDQSMATIDNVRVGQPIVANGAWPSKEGWYAHNKNSEADTDTGTGTSANMQRFMLGATFAALDPGDSRNTDPNDVYTKYARAVINMQNSKTMFSDGSTFFLPDDAKYSNDLADAVVANAPASTGDPKFQVPDYPSDCTIPLYGVYRERSLVFIEQYVDGNGDMQSKIMHSCPWNQYSRYPDLEYSADRDGHYEDLTENSGYVLVGWYAHSTTIDPSLVYPATQEEFNVAVEEWRDSNNETNQGADINFYTAYVAQKSIEQNLNATADTFDGFEFPVASYTLPGSMQDGKLCYEVAESSSELNLVDVSEMNAHLYDSEWTTGGRTYKANDTVALELNLKNADSSISLGPKPIVKSTDGQPTEVGQQDIGKGWNLALTLHHSKVMTATKSHSITIRFTFVKENNGSNTLADQRLEYKVNVNLAPSNYRVTYKANLPEPKEKLTLTNLNGFEQVGNGDAYSHTGTQAYGTTLLPKTTTLEVEGYDRENNWTYTRIADNSGSSSTVTMGTLSFDSVSGLSDEEKKAALEDGEIEVTAEYAAKPYTLTKESTINDKWDITYGNGATDAGVNNALDDASATVKYHSLVTFTPKNGGQPTSQPAEFIVLTFWDPVSGNVVETKRLDGFAQSKGNGSYAFAMPAKNVTVGYNDVMELYLDNGTIELSPDGFKQKRASGDPLVRTWHGDYKILQDENDNTNDHSTQNVLKISGDMTTRVDKTSSDGGEPARRIELGNLNIESADSIELVSSEDAGGSTKVNLLQQGKLKAKNILVPVGTDLALTGLGSNGKAIELDPLSAYEADGGPDRAAIGAVGDEANGNIRLDKVKLSMKLEAPSQASGIGSNYAASSDGTNPCGNVSISDSAITVEETTSPSGQYAGVWIGGASVSRVLMERTELLNEEGSNNHNARAIDGNEVTLRTCSIGAIDNPVREPIHAKNNLAFTDCKVYQEYKSQLTDIAMVGTDRGVTAVTNTTLQASFTSGGSTEELFTGQMLINDARSDVTINGVQVIEVSRGNITINADSVKQGDVTHNHGGVSYLLIEESAPSSGAPNVQVDGLSIGKTITVQPTDDTEKSVTIGTLAVKDNVKVVLDGNLKVIGVASVAGGKTLTVEKGPNAAGNYGVTYEMGLGGEGSYEQLGGSLAGNADVVVKGDMTLTNVTANCASYSIGSNGGSAATIGADGASGSPSTATTVTINGGSVTADTIGACGLHNSTFTFVKVESDSVINGNLVQDHYRIAYDKGRLALELVDEENNPLPTVLRTQTKNEVELVDLSGGIPANPKNAAASKFNCWYILNENGSQRLGLLADPNVLPSGLNGTGSLNATTKSKDMRDTASDDGTMTLIVHAWVDLTGTACIKNGRVFKGFAATDNAKSASVSQRGAWTAQLVSDGAHVAGRDYKVEFATALPAGTDLTLTVLSADNTVPHAYYHYTVSSGDAASVRFSDFTKMGTIAGKPPELANRAVGDSETFLLSADFGERGVDVDPADNTITFSLIAGDSADSISFSDDAQVSYTVTEATLGAITASGVNVVVNTVPAGEERFVGSKVYLVGMLSKTDGLAFGVPIDATAALKSGSEESPESKKQIDGTWVNGNTVAFDLGTYGGVEQGSYTLSVPVGTLPEGSYSVAWKLCAGAAPNALNGTCSNEENGQLDGSPITSPKLKVTCQQDDSHVLPAGVSHTVNYNYEATDSFTVTVEKQEALLAGFTPVAGLETREIASESGTVSVDVPTAAGIYRVRFSLKNNAGVNDDVYYTFIVP